MEVDQYYLIESGSALDIAKAAAQQNSEVLLTVQKYSESLGATGYLIGPTSRKLESLVFKGNPPEGFSKPKNKSRLCSPLPGSKHAKDFAALPKLVDGELQLHASLKYPVVVDYTTPSGKDDSEIIGLPPFCRDFLFISGEGPYCLVIPDAKPKIKELIDKGCTIKGGLESYTGELPGCRQITKDEWDLLVLQAKVNHAKANGEELALA